MTPTLCCPRCDSNYIVTRDYARKAGGAVGAAAGAAESAAAALGGAEAGATLGAGLVIPACCSFLHLVSAVRLPVDAPISTEHLSRSHFMPSLDSMCITTGHYGRMIWHYGFQPRSLSEVRM